MRPGLVLSVLEDSYGTWKSYAFVKRVRILLLVLLYASREEKVVRHWGKALHGS